MQVNKWALKLYNGGVTLDKISLALKLPISEIIEIIYNEKTTRRAKWANIK